MKRTEGWEKRLAELVRARERTPFAWGSFDCALFGADAVRAQTGEDPAAAYRGRYSTKRGAYAALRRICGGGVAEAVEANGWPEITPALARRGDVGLTGTPEGDAVVVCLGRDWAGPRFGAVGLARVERAAIMRAWRIG